MSVCPPIRWLYRLGGVFWRWLCRLVGGGGNVARYRGSRRSDQKMYPRLLTYELHRVIIAYVQLTDGVIFVHIVYDLVLEGILRR